MLKKLDDNLAKTKIGRKLNRMFSILELKILSHYKDPKVIELIKQIMKEDKDFLFKPSEIFMIYSISKAQKSMEGDYAEVGVYKGSSAKVICETKGKKPLYIFDTFEGLPEVDKIDTRFSEKMFDSSYEQVKKALSKYKNVHVYKGLFPDTAGPIKNKKFSFVHLDVDIYQSTKDCLEFFYKRMKKGGIILSHDYAKAEGVRKAFHEFLKDKPEDVIELTMTQCMMIKR